MGMTVFDESKHRRESTGRFAAKVGAEQKGHLPVEEVLPEGVASREVDHEGAVYYKDAEGLPHNPDGPAITTPDRFTYWLVTGEDPSGKPEWWLNQRWWYRHGELHRTDGPAIMQGDGTVHYWVEGRGISKREFYQQYPAQDDAGVSTVSEPLTDREFPGPVGDG